uniref:F-box and leucine-rich repeat protein 10/11 n=1 Tax=Tetraselmis sp. GSL018 TaxID=582737 RepID=A0A061S4V3_9CHLO
MEYRTRRRASRVDYAKLNGDLAGPSGDFRLHFHALLRFEGNKKNGIEVVDARSVSQGWLSGDGFQVPIGCCHRQSNGPRRHSDASGCNLSKSTSSAEQLGLKLPLAPSSGALSIEELLCDIGLEKEVQTLDVSTQAAGPRWNLHQWSQYWAIRRAISAKARKGKVPKAKKSRKMESVDDEAESSRVKLSDRGVDAAEGRPPRSGIQSDSQGRVAGRSIANGVLTKGISNESRTRILALVELGLSGTGPGAATAAPAAVQRSDVFRKIAAESPAKGGGLLQDFYASMSPSGTFRDFAFAPCCTAFWMHVNSGKQVLCCIPPTRHNLASYVAWVRRGDHGAGFFGAIAEQVVCVELQPGDTLLVPAGWLVAQAAVDDTLTFGGAFLNAGGLGGLLRAMAACDCLKAKGNRRAEELLWLAARHLAAECLKAAPEQDLLAARRRIRSGDGGFAADTGVLAELSPVGLSHASRAHAVEDARGSDLQSCSSADLQRADESSGGNHPSAPKAMKIKIIGRRRATSEEGEKDGHEASQAEGKPPERKLKVKLGGRLAGTSASSQDPSAAGRETLLGSGGPQLRRKVKLKMGNSVVAENQATKATRLKTRTGAPLEDIPQVDGAADEPDSDWVQPEQGDALAGGGGGLPSRGAEPAGRDAATPRDPAGKGTAEVPDTQMPNASGPGDAEAAPKLSGPREYVADSVTGVGDPSVQPAAGLAPPEWSRAPKQIGADQAGLHAAAISASGTAPPREALVEGPAHQAQAAPAARRPPALRKEASLLSRQLAEGRETRPPALDISHRPHRALSEASRIGLAQHAGAKPAFLEGASERNTPTPSAGPAASTSAPTEAADAQSMAAPALTAESRPPGPQGSEDGGLQASWERVASLRSCSRPLLEKYGSHTLAAGEKAQALGHSKDQGGPSPLQRLGDVADSGGPKRGGVAGEHDGFPRHSGPGKGPGQSPARAGEHSNVTVVGSAELSWPQLSTGDWPAPEGDLEGGRNGGAVRTGGSKDFARDFSREEAESGGGGGGCVAEKPEDRDGAGRDRPRSVKQSSGSNLSLALQEENHATVPGNNAVGLAQGSGGSHPGGPVDSSKPFPERLATQANRQPGDPGCREVQHENECGSSRRDGGHWKAEAESGAPGQDLQPTSPPAGSSAADPDVAENHSALNRGAVDGGARPPSRDLPQYELCTEVVPDTGDHIGVWRKEDAVALVEALRSRMQCGTARPPGDVTDPEGLLTDLEAGLECVGVRVSALRAAAPANWGLAEESKTINLEEGEAALPDALPDWPIYNDKEAMEEAGDSVPDAVVGSPGNETAKAGRRARGVDTTGNPGQIIGTQTRSTVRKPQRQTKQSVQSRLKKKLRIK